MDDRIYWERTIDHSVEVDVVQIYDARKGDAVCQIAYLVAVIDGRTSTRAGTHNALQQYVDRCTSLSSGGAFVLRNEGTRLR